MSSEITIGTDTVDTAPLSAAKAAEGRRREDAAGSSGLHSMVVFDLRDICSGIRRADTKVTQKMRVRMAIMLRRWMLLWLWRGRN